MSRAENKTDRLLKMEALLLAHPEGMTQSDLARHLGVDRSVIHRNLYDFQKVYPTEIDDDGRIRLDRSAYLVKVAFTLLKSGETPQSANETGRAYSVHWITGGQRLHFRNIGGPSFCPCCYP